LLLLRYLIPGGIWASKAKQKYTALLSMNLVLTLPPGYNTRLGIREQQGQGQILEMPLLTSIRNHACNLGFPSLSSLAYCCAANAAFRFKLSRQGSRCLRTQPPPPPAPFSRPIRRDISRQKRCDVNRNGTPQLIPEDFGVCAVLDLHSLLTRRWQKRDGWDHGPD
jgi:hypothetical protein